MKHTLPLFLLSTVGAIAARQSGCEPSPAICHTQDSNAQTYCFGPARSIGNAPVRPYTCNGDWEIALSGIYWKASQEGLDFSIDNAIGLTPTDYTTFGGTNPLNDLIDAKIYNVPPHWDFGFRLGVSYNTTCDSWDIGIKWTSYCTKSTTNKEAELTDNHTLLPTVSALQTSLGGPLGIQDITASWNLDLDLVDIALGREYWLSQRATLRPHIGIRYAHLNQELHTQLKSVQFVQQSSSTTFHDLTKWDQKFKGAGPLSSLTSSWHFGCGWSVFGNVDLSILYGHFDIDQDEYTLLAQSPFTKGKVLETENSFRTSRAAFDLALGVRWFGLFCECKYGIGAQIGWEQHLFFHQNQFFTVARNSISNTLGNGSTLQVGRENTIAQRSGTLATSGWTLSIQFDF